MQRMRRQLHDHELAESLDELVGPEYVKAFTTLAKAYAKMVKAMGRVVTTSIDQRELLVELQAVIVQHCSRILGELRDANPTSVARTRALLAPIDNFRARTSSRTSRAAPAAPANPVPAVAELEAALEA